MQSKTLWFGHGRPATNAMVRLSYRREDQARRAPASSLLLGAGAMLPIVAGALAVLVSAGWASWLIHVVIIWAAAVLCFLGGVRRGLSFRQFGGATVGEVAASLSVFACGFGAITAPQAAASLAVLILGYVSVAVLDSAAARRGEAPRYFAYFRPLQMVLPTLSLFFLLTRAGAHHSANPPAPQSDALWSEPIAQVGARRRDEGPSLRDLR